MEFNGTLIVSIISFITFVFLMNKILYEPILKVIEARQNLYDKNSKMENSSKEKTKALLDEKNATLAKAHFQASEIVKETTKTTKEKCSVEIHNAKLDVKKQIEDKEQELLDISKNVKNEIKSQMSEHVKEIISKVLNENIEVNLDEEKINKYLENR